LSQLFIEAVTQYRPTLNLKTKLNKITTDNYIIGPTHHLSVAFSLTILGLNNKKETKQFD